MLKLTVFLFALSAWAGSIPSSSPAIERGYHEMYDLRFDQAHLTFAECARKDPNDALARASNAAAYLFAEFDRLHILQSEFFTHDGNFLHAQKLTPDPSVKKAFEGELAAAENISNALLAKNPQDAEALFAKILTLGLRSDYLGLIEKRNLEALKVIKSTRATAEQLLALAPNYYDAYLAIGLENYMLSLKPAPVRWMLQWGGAQTDRERGIQTMKLVAEKGHYLVPYARLLLAVAALRSKDIPQARNILSDLSREFPHNRLYTEELARLR